MRRQFIPMSTRNRNKQVIGLISRQLETRRKKEEARKEAHDPVLVEKIKSAFMEFPDERKNIFLNIIDENYTENPAYLNPGLFNDLLPIDPGAAVLAVKAKHDKQAQIESDFSKGPARMIVGRAFKLNPKLINQENFDLVSSLFQNNLRSLEENENGLERFCRAHPELAQNNKHLKDVDFVQRKTERDMILDASIKESHLDMYSMKGYRTANIPKPKR